MTILLLSSNSPRTCPSRTLPQQSYISPSGRSCLLGKMTSPKRRGEEGEAAMEPHSCRVMGQMTAQHQGVAVSSASLILLHSSFSDFTSFLVRCNHLLLCALPCSDLPSFRRSSKSNNHLTLYPHVCSSDTLFGSTIKSPFRPPNDKRYDQNSVHHLLLATLQP